jgi:hypothetical protein
MVAPVDAESMGNFHHRLAGLESLDRLRLPALLIALAAIGCRQDKALMMTRQRVR